MLIEVAVHQIMPSNSAVTCILVTALLQSILRINITEYVRSTLGYATNLEHFYCISHGWVKRNNSFIVSFYPLTQYQGR